MQSNPYEIFRTWLGQAQSTPAIAEPTAMTLATATPEGIPSARIVLLKAYDERGFVFYTNTQSRKGRELDANPHAALVFYWMPLDKQVRIEGSIRRVSDVEADAYFASRERLKQAGAWASLQSQPLDARGTLEQRTTAIEAQYAGRDIPRPPHWTGYRLTPQSLEFWHQRDGRLHEREIYTRTGESWAHTLLYP